MPDLSERVFGGITLHLQLWFLEYIAKGIGFPHTPETKQIMLKKNTQTKIDYNEGKF